VDTYLNSALLSRLKEDLEGMGMEDVYFGANCLRVWANFSLIIHVDNMAFVIHRLDTHRWVMHGSVDIGPNASEEVMWIIGGDNED
jgi:hypothetical protein